MIPASRGSVAMTRATACSGVVTGTGTGVGDAGVGDAGAGDGVGDGVVGEPAQPATRTAMAATASRTDRMFVMVPGR
jgi:hypothetical protein